MSEAGKRIRSRIYRLGVKFQDINMKQFKELRKNNYFKEKKAKKILDHYKDLSRDNINN